MGGAAKELFMGREGKRERDMLFSLDKRSDFNWCFSVRSTYVSQLRSIPIRDSVGSYIRRRGSGANRGWRQIAKAVPRKFVI